MCQNDERFYMVCRKRQNSNCTIYIQTNTEKYREKNRKKKARYEKHSQNVSIICDASRQMKMNWNSKWFRNLVKRWDREASAAKSENLFCENRNDLSKIYKINLTFCRKGYSTCFIFFIYNIMLFHMCVSACAVQST